MRSVTYLGGCHCGPESCYVTPRTFLLNLDGGKSNVVEYTIHCNGGYLRRQIDTGVVRVSAF
jgi:hypothetical protein